MTQTAASVMTGDLPRDWRAPSLLDRLFPDLEGAAADPAHGSRHGPLHQGMGDRGAQAGARTTARGATQGEVHGHVHIEAVVGAGALAWAEGEAGRPFDSFLSPVARSPLPDHDDPRQALRRAVLRHVDWLFNTIRPEPGSLAASEPVGHAPDRVALPWRDLPHVQRSVLNYGIPAFTGRLLTALDSRELERSLEEALRRFEPRLRPESIRITVASGAEATTGVPGAMPAADRAAPQVRVFIRAELWDRSRPQMLTLAADMDVDTGRTRVLDLGG
ncbi:type VI secretion system baseplate subunit TssE [Roseateles amylovorans]|uniref:GPW/gp25 family protein n=1 Tax=Roseateles amylovorans TaxID=2978473 RepID=A0ABY6B0E0_9BURK|nr:GPW/gp25 family protein [Roseateles amylovorans]UXH78520.1 GPW/gp25 family protein [Roseateles amylovorans]